MYYKSYVLQNFILTEYPEGLLIGHLYRYEVDSAWLNGLEAFPGWDAYTGSFSIIDVEGNEIARNLISNGSSLGDESEIQGRSMGTVCYSITYEITVSTPYGSDTYYETDYNCTTYSSGDLQSGGVPAEPAPLIPDVDETPTPTRKNLCSEDGYVVIDEVCISKNKFWDTDQTFGERCDDISFLHHANSFTAEVIGLGGTYVNRVSNLVINIELSVNCISIPEQYLSTSFEAASNFARIFNLSRTRIEYELENETLAPNNIAIRQRLISIITSRLQASFPGSTFGLGGCQGNISITQANYGC